MVEPEIAYADARRRHRRWRKAWSSTSSRRVLDRRQRELKTLEREHLEARSGEGAVPARLRTTRRRRSCSRRVSRSRTAATSAAPTRRCCRSSSTGRSRCIDYPAAIKAFYMKPDPERARQGALRGRARAGRLRRDHRRRPASRRSTICCCSASRSTSCRRKRSSGISTCAATARCPTAASAWASSACVSWICGLEHVRETIPYPRMLYRLYP